MIQKRFWKGIKAVLPLAITLVICVWLYNGIDSFFEAILRPLLGPYYFPSLGFWVGIVLIFFIGMAMNVWISKKIYAGFDSLLRRIPLIRTLYISIHDLMRFFEKQPGQEGKVVAVDLFGVRAVGLLTCEDFSDLPKGMGGQEYVAVYLPLSYQIGGHTLIVPRKWVTSLDWPVESMMRWAVTAGVKGQNKERA